MFLGLPDPYPDTVHRQRYGAEDPDPYQNVTDPEHWLGSTGASVNVCETFPFIRKYLYVKSLKPNNSGMLIGKRGSV
jgi:hypothetical protein